MQVVSLDFETFRIAPGAICPKIICAALASRDQQDKLGTLLIGNHPDEYLEQQLHDLLIDPDVLIVTHNGGFDWGAAAATYPALIPLIFDALEAGRLTDTLWREKLINLSISGKITDMKMPDGSTQKIGYSLANLEMGYFGRDRSADKGAGPNDDETWRANYQVLDGWHSKDYPEDARTYALEDAEGTLLVYEGQEAKKADWPMASTVTEGFQLASSFALNLMTAWGFKVDHAAVAELEAEVTKRLAKVEGGLIESGILRPAILPAPHKRQLKKVLEILQEQLGHIPLIDDEVQYLDHRALLEQHSIKFSAGKDGSINTAVLQDHAAEVFKRLGKIPEMTDSGERLKLDAEVQEMLAVHDSLMKLYQGRQLLSKLVGQQIPLLKSADIVYPRYDALKETSRTSSYGNKKGDPGLYPAVHIQGVPNEIEGLDPRKCYVPRPRRALFDNDYTALELACTGQITYDLFGKSVHLERYNQGVDLHGYLGAQLVVMGSTDGLGLEFTQGCRTEGILSDPMAVYEAFMLCKKHEDEAVRKWWKESRNFAKPVGLGFPGGLGPATMVEFARKTYSVILTEEQAGAFREMWREVYPEMPLFFNWVNGQVDQYNDGEETLYWYTTQLGMIRRGATFCAAANGKCMQSPGAEGAKIAVIKVQRECYDPTRESVLFGCRPIAFVHDQLIGETTEDDSLWHDQCMRVREIMCESMRAVLPDINMRSDEAHLTSVWTKQSVPTFGPDGRLIPWRPK